MASWGGLSSPPLNRDFPGRLESLPHKTECLRSKYRSRQSPISNRFDVVSPVVATTATAGDHSIVWPVPVAAITATVDGRSFVWPAPVVAIAAAVADR